jgi:hypothetical protein
VVSVQCQYLSSHLCLLLLSYVYFDFLVYIQDLGGIDEPFVIDCYDWDADGVHSLIGKLTTTFREFTFGPVQLALINPRKFGRY